MTESTIQNRKEMKSTKYGKKLLLKKEKLRCVIK